MKSKRDGLCEHVPNKTAAYAKGAPMRMRPTSLRLMVR